MESNHYSAAIPRGLQEKLLQNEVVLFAGAGLSKNAGAPTWKELLTELLNRCADEDIEIDAREKKELVQLIASHPTHMLIAAQDLRARLKEKMDEYIEKRFGELEPLPTHRTIAKIRFRGIVTTNYDKLIETEIYRFTGSHPKILLPDDTFQLARIEDSSPWILKLHGTCDKPDQIIIGWNDYESILSDESLQNINRRLFQRYTFLFAGFGLEDPNALSQLQQICRIYRHSNQRHYALIEDAAVGRIHEKYFLAKYNIQLLRYKKTSDAHPEVDEFFTRLLNLASNPHHIPDDSRIPRMNKGLVLIKGVRPYPDGSSDNVLLVRNDNPQWTIDITHPDGSTYEQRAFFLPSVDIKKLDAWLIKKDVASLLNLEQSDFEIQIHDPPLESIKPRLGTGQKTRYTFYFISVEFTKNISLFEEYIVFIGRRRYEWHTLWGLREHPATKNLNNDVLLAIRDRFGSMLEGLSTSSKNTIGSFSDPYSVRAEHYGDLPWVKDKDIFEAILPNTMSKDLKGVLDLGCGPAVLGSYVLSKHKIPYVGIDISSAMVSAATSALQSTSPRSSCKIIRGDIMTDALKTRRDGYLFVLKNVLHMLPAPRKLMATLVKRYGHPYHVVIVETVCPDPGSLAWVQSLFELLEITYKRNWYVKNQFQNLINLWGCEILEETVFPQSINIDRWLNSRSLRPEQLTQVKRFFEEIPGEIVDSMQIRNLPDGTKQMLRLQYIYKVNPPSASRRTAANSRDADLSSRSQNGGTK